ncbi:hypothetical protein Q7P37_008458 [Cladosporium fusiforme]
MPPHGTALGLHPYTTSPLSLFSIATSLSHVEPSIPSWLTVTPARALQNSVATIAGTSSNLHAITAVIFGFGSLGAGLYLYVWRNRSIRGLAAWLGSKFTGSISIASTHPLNRDILTYLEKNGLNRKAKSLVLVNPNSLPPINDTSPQVVYRSQSCAAINAWSTFRPLAPFFFWHNGYRLCLTRHEEQQSLYKDGKYTRTMNEPVDPSRNQTITLTCWSLGAGVQPVKDFIDQIQEAVNSKTDTTTIFRAHCLRDTQKFYWDAGVDRPARTVDSIALEAKKKSALLKECTRYFSDEEQRFYACRGLPYRRGLLFYGPPGTGKTSFTVALAGHFKLNVYMVSMSDGALNDRGLVKLFDALPKRCIVLLEDIDSSGINREPAEVEVVVRSDEGYLKRKVKVGVTLSGLLNVLDGPASGIGRLVVLTTNLPDSLDAALLRPGRIDSKILFGYASREVSAQIFLHIFTRTADEISIEEKQGDETAVHSSSQDLQVLAEQFAACIPETRISPAEVQGYLMQHRDDSVAAVRNAAAWAKETLDIKEAGANVAFFENEVQSGRRGPQRTSEPEKSATRQKNDERLAVAAPRRAPSARFRSNLSNPFPEFGNDNGHDENVDGDEEYGTNDDDGDEDALRTVATLAYNLPGTTVIGTVL